MKRLFLVSAICVLLLSACGTASTAASTVTPAPLPVLQVDAQHMLTPDLAYNISAGEGFVLDASNYDFGTASGPTVVQVVMGGRVYQTNWVSGATSQAIRAVELEPAPGLARLSVFSAGQQLIVAIGSLDAHGQFSPMWVGVVNFN
jgi:hypothetical protein